jgi:hypothetical protein
MPYLIPKEALAIAALCGKGDPAPLTGVAVDLHADADGGRLDLAATDGKIAAVVSFGAKDTPFDGFQPIIIPSEAIPHAKRLAAACPDAPAEHEGMVELDLDDPAKPRLTSVDHAAVYTFTPVSGVYPDLSAVWPGAPDAELTVPVERLARMVALLKGAKVDAVRIGISFVDVLPHALTFEADGAVSIRGFVLGVQADGADEEGGDE